MHQVLGGKVTSNNDNLMVPIEVLSKGLGYEYKYDEKSKEIELTSPYQTMRLIVKLKNTNVNLSKYNPVEIIEGLNNVFVLQFDSIEDTKLAYEQIQKDKISVYVEPDYYISGESTAKVSSSDASGTYNSWGVEYIEADKYATYLQKQNTTNSITVGVVDSGIDYNHTIFNNRIKSGGYDFVNSDYYPYDDHGHGTHVSGTIVDCTPGLSINILPVKVLSYNNSGTGLNIANGIQYAANKGVDVINFSIGMYSHWNYLHDVIESAIENDVVFVMSAGNDNNNTIYECPSDMSSPIVVSAIDSWGDKCSFSNYGSTIDVAAPGYYIYSAYPGGGYAYMNGTSMAAPHISAVCAMYRLKYPSLTVYEVEKLVQKNVKDLGSTGFDIYYGYGVPSLSLDIQSNENLVKVSSVKLNKITLKLIKGKNETLKATINPSNAMNKNVTWKSSNTKVAKVDSSGKVTAVGAGSATITVTTKDGSKTVTCKVTVTNSNTNTSDIESKILGKFKIDDYGGIVKFNKNELVWGWINSEGGSDKILSKKSEGNKIYYTIQSDISDLGEDPIYETLTIEIELINDNTIRYSTKYSSSIENIYNKYEFINYVYHLGYTSKESLYSSTMFWGITRQDINEFYERYL